jgi:hypothetical protein
MREMLDFVRSPAGRKAAEQYRTGQLMPLADGWFFYADCFCASPPGGRKD